MQDLSEGLPVIFWEDDVQLYGFFVRIMVYLRTDMVISEAGVNINYVFPATWLVP